jgi:hypothetical protein
MKLTAGVVMAMAFLAADSVKTGPWGGTGLLVRVTKEGATIEADCAHGSIAKPLVLDAAGRFDVEGVWIPEHAGPVRRDEEPAQQRARYAGRVDEKTMTLEISRGEDRVGTFTLTHGSEGRLTKCR